jgi:hypothetical protein
MVTFMELWACVSSEWHSEGQLLGYCQAWEWVATVGRGGISVGAQREGKQEEQVDEQPLLVPAALRAAVSVGTAYRPCL